MLLSRKEFLGFYNHEMEFASIRGVTISQGHAKELSEMYDIYKDSKNDKEFTKKMINAGYGKIN